MPFGYMGKALWVDLSLGSISEEEIPDKIYKQFLSGIGLASYLLYREIPPHTDPLGPQNILGFVAGLLTGTPTLFTARWMATAKSPLTGTWGEANCGGTLSPAIKRSGYDGIFFKGISPHPVYLLIYGGKIELRDASDLWGLDTVQTEQCLRERHPGSSVACIGPAGEKLSLISGISNDGGRMAARSGLGAVMGSKRLKALVLQGKTPVKVHDPQQVQALSKKAYFWTRLQIPLPSGWVMKFAGTLMRWLPVQIAQDGILYKWMLRRWGTISMNQMSVEMGDAPIQNWQGSDRTFNLRRSASSNPDHITRYETRKYHCRSCGLGCGGIVSHPALKEESHKPEYETVMAWGGLLLNEDLESIFIANDRLNRAGIDSISAGSSVAFAIECVERGLISQEALGGIDLRWGNSKAILALLDKMIQREGIGDLLADGSRKAAERIGTETLPYAVQAGGQELAMHDGRYDPGFALHAAVEAAPGRHTVGSQLYYEMNQLWTRVKGLPKIARLYSKNQKYQTSASQAAAAVANSRFAQVRDGAGLCMFGTFIGVSRVPAFEWLNAVTGWKKSPDEYMLIGARIQALKQLFNLREGVSLKHTVNRRSLGLPPLKHGANRQRTVPLDKLVHDYWLASGYDEETGVPKPETLRQLGIDHLLDSSYYSH